jgi:hypothetical protein
MISIISGAPRGNPRSNAASQDPTPLDLVRTELHYGAEFAH